jgi:hypothetical protein
MAACLVHGPHEGFRCNKCHGREAQGEGLLSFILNILVFGMALAFIMVYSKNVSGFLPWVLGVCTVLSGVYVFLDMSKKFWGVQLLLGAAVGLLIATGVQFHKSDVPASVAVRTSVTNGAAHSAREAPPMRRPVKARRKYAGTKRLLPVATAQPDSAVSRKNQSGDAFGEYLGFSNGDYAYMLIREGNDTMKFILGGSVSLSDFTPGDTLRVHWKIDKVPDGRQTSRGGSSPDSIEQIIACSAAKRNF